MSSLFILLSGFPSNRKEDSPSHFEAVKLLLLKTKVLVIFFCTVGTMYKGFCDIILSIYFSQTLSKALDSQETWNIKICSYEVENPFLISCTWVGFDHLSFRNYGCLFGIWNILDDNAFLMKFWVWFLGMRMSFPV